MQCCMSFRVITKFLGGPPREGMGNVRRQIHSVATALHPKVAASSCQRNVSCEGTKALVRSVVERDRTVEEKYILHWIRLSNNMPAG